MPTGVYFHSEEQRRKMIESLKRLYAEGKLQPWNKGKDSMMATASERFWAKVDKRGENECWIWTGHHSRGYGRFRLSKTAQKFVLAHRFAYLEVKGPILEGMTLDHLCRNRLCVNPSHLEVVDMQTNLLRGNGIAAANARKTHCPRGHPYDIFNTHFRKDGGRDCRACRQH